MARSIGTRPWRVRARSAMGNAPLAADGMVFGTSTDHHVYAVDAATGRLQWKHRVADRSPPLVALLRPPRVGHSLGSLHIGMPAAGDRPGALHTVHSRTGETRWRTEIGEASVFDVLVEGGVVFACCSDGVRTFEAGSGTQRWHRTVENLPSVRWGGPASADGIVACVGEIRQSWSSADAVCVIVAFDLDSGERLWVRSIETTGVRLAASPGRLYLATSQGELIALELRTGEESRVRDDGPNWIFAFPARPTRTMSTVAMRPGGFTPVLVSHTPVSAALSTPVVTSDGVFVGSQNGNTYRANVVDGRLSYYTWETDLQVRAVAHGQGLVFAGFIDGMVNACPAEGGDFHWATISPVGRVAGLTCADGMLYVSGDPFLAAFDATTGAGPWRWPRQRTTTSRR
ncbi:PQQ-binding-like beta-propeller repeat protein [Micromonospora sp. LOL_023]|uniref:outer membrane protein assembly factor BamB family protein n=1 Tax=Micromonospora sp. LOL_023 TaxID=3345418 RepID=UPI003A8B16FA